MAFLLPFIDLGLGQSPMLGGDPADWALWMPGYGGVRLLIDGGLNAGFDEGPILKVAIGWIAVLTFAVVVMLRRIVKGSVRHALGGKRRPLRTRFRTWPSSS